MAEPHDPGAFIDRVADAAAQDGLFTPIGRAIIAKIDERQRHAAQHAALPAQGDPGDEWDERPRSSGRR